MVLHHLSFLNYRINKTDPSLAARQVTQSQLQYRVCIWESMKSSGQKNGSSMSKI